MEIPYDITEKIFGSLPISSLLRCRCVCKSWRDAISSLDFSAKDFLLIIEKKTLPLSEHLEQLLNIKKRSHLSSDSLQMMNLSCLEFSRKSYNFLNPRARITTKLDSDLQFVNSCNGFIFLKECVPVYLPDRSTGLFKQDDVMRMVNPVTGEYITLPPFTKRWGWDLNQCVLGFSNLNNQYKALRISYPIDQNGIACNWEADVYTLGTDSWRRIGAIPTFEDASSTAFVNGHFHWLMFSVNNTGPCGIWVFDFETEEFGTLSLPYHCNKMRANLGVYKDSIFVSRHVDDDYYDENEYSHAAIELWVMKDYGVVESWIKILVLENELDFRFFYYLKVVKFLVNGDLLLHNGHYLIFYNPRERVYKRLDIPREIELIHDQKEFDVGVLDPSFSTLKYTMVGDNLKVLNAALPPALN